MKQVKPGFTNYQPHSSTLGPEVKLKGGGTKHTKNSGNSENSDYSKNSENYQKAKRSKKKKKNQVKVTRRQTSQDAMRRTRPFP